MKLYFIIIFSFLYLVSFSQKIDFNDTINLNVATLKFNKFGTLDTVGLDTTRNHLELISNDLDILLPYVNLGQKGTPTMSLVFIERKKFDDFMFFNPYLNSIFLPENSKHFITNKPYTDIEFLGTTKINEQQTLNALTTFTIKEKTNIGLNLRLKTARNLATESENSSLTSLNFWVNHKYKKYEIFATYFSNKIKREENGGFEDSADIESTIFFVDNVKNVLNYNGLYINHFYNFSPALIIGHRLEYATISRTFFESSLNNYFGENFISENETYDSTGINNLKNSIDIKFTKKYNITLSISNQIQRLYYFKGYFYDLKGELYNSLFSSFSIKNFKLLFLNINLLTNYYFLERKKGDFDVFLEQNINFNILGGTNLIISESYTKSKPDFFLENYNGNYDFWNNTFDKINTSSFETKITNNKYNFEAGANFQMINNFVYFNQKGKPIQTKDEQIIKTLWAKTTIKLGVFAADFQYVFQHNSDTITLNIPKHLAATSFYFSFPIFKKAVFIKMGVNINYSSEYYAYTYRPTTGIFYHNFYEKTGNYPILDAFFTAKIGNTTIIVKGEHLNAGLLKPFYSTTRHYHIESYYLRFGVKWWFRN